MALDTRCGRVEGEPSSASASGSRWIATRSASSGLRWLKCPCSVASSSSARLPALGLRLHG